MYHEALPQQRTTNKSINSQRSLQYCLVPVTMSGLSQAVAILKATFDKYAGKEGDKNTLTKRELAELLRNELPSGGVSTRCSVAAPQSCKCNISPYNSSCLSVFPQPTCKAAENNFFSMLDDDNNNVVNFTEYVNFVATFTVMSHQK